MKLRRLIQDIKEEINKDIETLKNNQSEINNSISQINIVIKAW
jgi:gas vesicle protein